MVKGNMMKKRKIWISGIAVAVAGLILLNTILQLAPGSAFAQQSFTGIDTVISAHGEQDPFIIVELVPDHDAAKLGYLVGGDEPFYYDSVSGGYLDYTERLASLTSPEEREEFSSQMQIRLSLITGDSTMPLSYSEYQESYAQKEGYTQLELKEPEILPSGTAGYSMENVGSNQGDYSFTTSYEVAASGGMFNQNIVYYDRDAEERYYNPVFSRIDDLSAVSGGAYVVKSATMLSSYGDAASGVVYWSSDFGNTFVKADGTETISTSSLPDQGDTSSQDAGSDGTADTNTDMNADTNANPDSGTDANPDSDSGSTAGTGDLSRALGLPLEDVDPDAAAKTEEGGADDPAALSVDGTLTDPDETLTDPEGAAGGNLAGNASPAEPASVDDGTDVFGSGSDAVTYSNASSAASSGAYYEVYFSYVENPSADSGATYYQVSGVSFDAGQGAFYGAVLDADDPYILAADGHFNSVGASYQYTGEGNGAYRLAEGGSLDADVTVYFVYYQGGFTNNDLFKQYVFNQSGLLNEENADISIEIIPMTPEQFNSYDGSMDMLYISGSSALVNGTDTYGADNDITALAAYDIFSRVVSEETYLPVMLDYSILENGNSSGTNIYKLGVLLTAQELDVENAVFTAGSNDNLSIAVADGITAFSDADHHYVNGNVYVIPGDTVSGTFISDFSKIFLDDSSAENDDFQTDADNIGFGDVAETIILENLYREVENSAGTGNSYDMFDQKLSKAIAVEYIISYAAKREEYINYEIKVLDIEPCTTYAATQSQIENNIRNYLGIADDSPYTVNVTHMTSAEFISKVEDLCEYDMIYMGLYTDTINTSNGRTVYNDSAMNGLVYTNIGDYQYDYAAIGLFDTDYSNPANHFSQYNLSGSTQIWWNPYDGTKPGVINYWQQPWREGLYECVRYSGNDFTDEKVDAVRNFVKSGLPVVLADNFLTSAGGNTYVYDYPYNSNGTKNTSQNGYIDNCSRVYSLIDEIKNSANVMTESELSKSAAKKKILFQYITLGKPVLSVSTDAKEAGQAYINTKGSTVSLDFSIANFGSADADATFNCVIYADFNADGRYSNSTELIGANDFTITLNNVRQPVKSKTDDEGNSYYYYELSPNSSGTMYHLEYNLSEDYVGVIPIKIKVSQSSNDYRYDSEELYFYTSNTTGEKLSIRVLQILPTAASGYSMNVFNMGEAGVYDGNLSVTSPFYMYLHQLEDYDIQIDAMQAETTYADMYAENPEFLDDYDMLILGFADCYVFMQDGIDYSGKVAAGYQGVKDFIDSGKSVLFTHDTTAYGSNPLYGKGIWAYDMNLLLPQDVGLDRYGVNTSYLLQAGLNLSAKDTATTYNVADFQSLRKAYEEGILTKSSYTSAELFNLIVKEAAEKNKDIAYKPNSDKAVLVNQVQGRSSMTINGNSYDFKYYSAKGITGGLPETTQVELLNEGQILVYPYNILDQITANNNVMTVAATHGQYYQIDMNEDADQDGESDITVWLSLTGSSDYETARKDARNNYYIYTKGNVTYSGVGHTNINYYGNETEIKLYINTMVAAYQAGAHAPSLTVKQGSDTDSGDLTTLYVSFDSSIDETGAVNEGAQIDMGTEAVYFSVNDTNIARGGTKRISVDYYLIYGDEVPEGVSSSVVVNLGTEEEPVYAKKMDWVTYKQNGSVQDPTNVTSGVMYSVEVPYDVINEVEDNKALIWICATTSLWRENANPDTAAPSGVYTTHRDLYVQRIGLFDLD